MPRPAPSIPPPAVALTGVAVQSLLARGVPPRDLPGRRTVAAAVVAAAFTLSSLAFRGFRAHDTTPDPVHPEQASALVTDGVFGVTRNPMYVGLTGLVLANAVRTGRLRSLLPVIGVLAWLDRVQIPAEERALTATFATAYTDYQGSVRRWF